MTRPLHGLRVLELTHVWSGPLCGQVLADLGAEVIRVETRSRLDIHRRGGPYPEGKAGVNRSGTWNAQNRGKYGCTLDLKTAEGKQLLLELVGKSDVTIENFTPGTLDRLGLGFEQLRAANPRILLLSLSGFGHTGPHRDSMAYGPMMDAATGLSAATTYGDGIPRAVNGWAADVGGALYGCAAILRSLLESDSVARHLDLSQFEAAVMFVTEGLLARANPDGQGSSDVGAGLAFTARTADPERWIAVAVRTVEGIERLCDLIGGPPFTLRIVRRIHTHGLEMAREELAQGVDAWMSARPQREALATLRSAGVPSAPIATVPDLLADARLESSGAWLDLTHSEAGATRSYGPSIRLHDMPASLRPAPLLGGDNDYVFGTILGLPAQRIQELVERKVL